MQEMAAIKKAIKQKKMMAIRQPPNITAVLLGGFSASLEGTYQCASRRTWKGGAARMAGITVEGCGGERARPSEQAWGGRVGRGRDPKN